VSSWGQRMIKVVLFDFGGVLTGSGKKGFIGQTIADLYGVDPATLDISNMHYMLRRGRGDEDTFFEELNNRYGKQVTKEMFVEKAQAEFEPTKEVYELAEAMRTHGIRTGILSNIFAMNARVLRKQGWYDGFDPIILSCEEGCAKPEDEFYGIAIERVGVKPEEILFIDDQDKCMPPAKAAGMHTLIATSPEQVIGDAKKIIKELNGVDL
jgi:epoxide hydrolase-like predicted phosphatase